MDPEQFLSTIASFDNIGLSKKIGYLPIKTIIYGMGLKIEDVIAVYGDKLSHKVSKNNNSCISSGALYLYLRDDLIQAKHWTDAVNFGIKTPRDLVDFLDTNWLENDHVLFRLLKEIYGS